MDRSLRAVLLGTFTLRFSTGLTGSMLAFYLVHLPEHGGPVVDNRVVGLYAALFYLTELVLSPLFGILSDRFGHHRIMVYGPVFGAIAVVLTGLTTNLALLGGTRILEGASSAASVPSILGFIALATAGNEVLRGKTAARFEGATLAGIGVGAIVGVKLFEMVGPTAFYLNAVLYGVSFLIYRFGVKDPAGESAAVAGEHVHLDRYLALIRSSHVLVLAPTWIAVNAALGVWLSQSIFQLAKGDPNGRFPNQALMAGFDANQITIGAIVVAVVFGAGLLYWGNRFKSLRRTTIIGYGVIGGAVLVGAGIGVNHLATAHPLDRHRGRRPRGGRALRAGRGDPGRARSAGRHVRAVPVRSRRDHGPLFGLPRPRPDHRQSHRRVRRRVARDRRDVHRDARAAGHRDRPAGTAPRRGAPVRPGRDGPGRRRGRDLIDRRETPGTPPPALGPHEIACAILAPPVAGSAHTTPPPVTPSEAPARSDS